MPEVSRKSGESNEMKCLRRILTPRLDGSLLVPKEILESFKDLHNGGRESVLKMWEQTGYQKDGILILRDDVQIFFRTCTYCIICNMVNSSIPLLQDAFIKKCKRKIETISEQDMWVDGEFQSEKDMAEAGLKESLDCINTLAM